jgi:site-specific DNA recombinase
MCGHMRTAVYARFSSDLQRQTSLDDQVRNCEEYARRNGWLWQADQVFTDAGISGASIEGRPGLQSLLAAAAQHLRPFDVLLVDDSSRVSRDLADALRIVQRLKFAGVRVIYISQGIDSDSEQHETLIAVHGLVDGLYLREMSAKIKRGLKGQLERGFTTGSKTYGYRSIGIPDPNRHGEMIGYRLEIEPSEAKVIREIFAWYIAGATMPSILARLVGQGYPSPRGGRWRIGAVRRILRNEKYRGLLIWGQRSGTRKPGSRTKAVRATPRDQWHVLERPELRIITDELWTQAQARRCETDAS